MNLKFLYLYRDSGNYKYWGSNVFKNPELNTSHELTKRVNGMLYDGLFIANQVQVSELFPVAEGYPSDEDHCFHEFADFEETQDSASDTLDRTASEFVSALERESRKGWNAFDPNTR